MAEKTVDEYSKTWEKSYNVGSRATLDLKNKYGDIHITTWKQNKISIKVTITVDVSSQEKADKALAFIEIKDASSDELVTVSTKFGADGSGKMNKRLHIDYEVKMPISNHLKVSNKFGDVYLNELDGRAHIKVSYGNLKCGVLNNSNNHIQLAFSRGKCTVGDFTSGSIVMKYSKLSINKADKLNLNSRFSTFRIGTATTMDCKSQYDNMEIERVGDLDLDGRFSDFEIGVLVRKLKVDLEYGDLEVDRVTSLVSEIIIEIKFGDVELCFDEGTSYSLEASGEFGDIDFPKSLTSLTTNESKSTSFYLKGVVGRVAPGAKVKIHCKYGDVDLTYKED